ncbi:MAG: hypothetical protein WD876_02520 [Candidatus Pacearchaeota archaeon]
MEKEQKKFTFRQRWFPSLEDAIDNDNIMSCFGRWARTLFVGGFLAWTGYQTIGNNIDYSQGQRVGVINKVSEKGLIWTTKEGQLSLEGRTSTGEPTGAGTWDFSIEKGSKNAEDIYSQIKKYMEDGKRVKISYNEPFATWPWRSETNYLIQSVEPLNK